MKLLKVTAPYCNCLQEVWCKRVDERMKTSIGNEERLEMAQLSATVVLVHGAWADESSWKKVRDWLDKISVKTVTVGLLMASLKEDVTTLDMVLAAIDGPVILVGHAYAGAVIAETQSAQVKALVYIAGLAPDEGETVVDVFNRFGHDDQAPVLEPASDGRIWLSPEAFVTAFAQYATAEEQKALATAQRPISPACIVTPVGTPLWKRVPTWYLVAQHDHMIPEKTQRFMADRIGAHTRAYPVDHLPSVTAPSLVADIIVDALNVSAA
ncbi:alpha/beta hydrolase [Dyella sp. C11]|uniref:alpha/beta fold hydrolase n=1 Tax=Dyella sp. C11 TaxID=2126991 RepID=UPI0018E54B3A|nr:alpha/beta hydrolase [Dyella sp. C11]